MSNLTLNRTYLRTLTCGAVALLMAACGGGGGGTDAGANAGANTSASQPTFLPSEAGATAPVASAPAATGSAAPTAATTPGPFGQDASAYTLAFSDEFENGLDSKFWTDHAWYEKSNATKNYTVEDGKLKIWPARDASGKFFNRTIDTDGKYYQQYGYFEVEAKLPVGKGTWPAFWLFNHIDDRRPEIDVMEAYAGGVAPWGTMIDGQPHPTMYAATIWKDATVQAGMKKIATPDLSAGFHKYALKWEPGKQTYYFDGREVYSINVSMTDKMYLMLDLWYGSASGQPDDTTPTGKGNSYEVNYIRTWTFK